MEKIFKPDIEGEIEEFQRTSQDLRRKEKIDISVEELVRSFDGLKEQTLIEDVWLKLENTESNTIEKDDWVSVMKIAKKYKKRNPKELKKDIENNEYERPLILKMGDRYILIAGNTRLCTAAAMGVNPKVFIGEIGEDMNESELLKGGNADNKSLIQIAKKHDAKNYYHIDNMVQSLKKELEMGIKIEMEHTDDKDKAKEIAMDHLWENPSYYTKLKKSNIEEEVINNIKTDLNEKCWKGYTQKGMKTMFGKRYPNCVKKTKTNEASSPAQQAAIAINMKKKGIEPKKETKEQTDASSSGSYEGNAFGPMIKREIHKINNAKLTEEQEIEFKEATDASSSGSYDVPAFGKTTKGGRKNPLKIDGPDSIYKGRAVKDKNFPKWGGPDSIYKGRAVKDKNFPKWGGPDSVFVKVKDKCKKFPYCNQGNTGALDFIKEDQEIKDAITETSKKFGIPYKEMEKIVLNEITKIFI
jgi:hypothetical protein